MDRSVLTYFGLTVNRISAWACLAVLASAAEAFGMWLIVPLLQFLEHGESYFIEEMTSNFIGSLVLPLVSVNGRVDFLDFLILIFIALLLRSVIIYFRAVYVSWLRQRMHHSARMGFFSSLVRADLQSVERLNSGKVINCLTTEINRGAGSLSALLEMYASLIVILGFGIVLVFISGWLTVVALFFIGIGAVAVNIYVRNTKDLSYKTSTANSDMSEYVTSRFGIFRTVKVLGIAEQEIARLESRSEDVTDKLFGLAKLSSAIDLIIEPIVMGTGFAILFVASTYLNLDLAETGVFLLILIRLLPLSKQCLKSRQTYYSAYGSLYTVYDYAMVLKKSEERQCKGDAALPEDYSIQFDRVSFGYTSGHAMLNDITFNVAPGEITALVGPSGQGKSTLLDLLLGLRKPVEGEILVDGHSLDSIDLDRFRSKIGVVSQDLDIIEGSIADNLRLGSPEASHDLLDEALNFARASDFVENLSAGLDTQIGEKGVGLSGGQKQRLALARVYLQKDLKLLVLDEPTSALDHSTEKDLIESIKRLNEERKVGVVLVTHRAALAELAERVFVVDRGKIVSFGSHESLVVENYWYRDLVTK